MKNRKNSECVTKCSKYGDCALIGHYDYSINVPRIFIPVARSGKRIPKPNTYVCGTYYHTVDHCSECANFTRITLKVRL
jgi:hypothetical protein